MTDVARGHSRRPVGRERPGDRRRVHLVPYALVFTVALAARLWVVLGEGGLRGNYFYDPAVYYAAADGLTHGRMPYQDYVLVHPPGIALVTTPFALLGRLTSDHAGFVAGNLAFTALSAINAVLVVHVARRFGVPMRPALLGGLFYAVWLGAVSAEFLIRLEPLGNFFLLAALLTLADDRPSSTRLRPVLCGLLLACLVNVKVWFLVPVVIVVGWQLVRTRSGRQVMTTVAGFVAGCVVIDLPFYAVAGSRMFRAVVTAQLGRPANDVSVHGRIDKLSGVSQAWGFRFNTDGVSHDVGAQVLVLAFVVLTIGACAAAVRHPAGRLWVTMLAVQLAVFAVTQVWFYTYSDYLAVPLALTLATAAAPAGRTRRGHVPGLLSASAVTAGSAVLALVALAGPGLGLVPAYPGARRFAAAAHGEHCLVTDTPMNLIQLNALSRSFSPGCRNIVDLIGFEIGATDPADDQYVASHAPRLQADLCAYFTSGDAVLLDSYSLRHRLSASCAARIRDGVVLAREGDLVLIRLAGR